MTENLTQSAIDAMVNEKIAEVQKALESKLAEKDGEIEKLKAKNSELLGEKKKFKTEAEKAAEALKGEDVPEEMKKQLAEMAEELNKYKQAEKEAKASAEKERLELLQRNAQEKGEYQQLLDAEKEAWVKKYKEFEENYVNEKTSIQSALEAKEKEAKEWQDRFLNSQKSDFVNRALDEINVISEMKELAKSYFKDKVQIEMTDEGTNAFILENGEKTSVSEYAKAFAQTEMGKRLVAAPANSGGSDYGKGGSGGVDKSLFDPKSPLFNRTKALQTYLSDQATYGPVAKQFGLI